MLFWKNERQWNRKPEYEKSWLNSVWMYFNVSMIDMCTNLISIWQNYYRLANEVWGKVIFSEVCVKNSVHKGGGWYPSMHCRWYPSMSCSRSPDQWVVSQHALQVSRGEVSRPTPRGEVEGSGWGGLQAHTQGGCPSPHWGGSPGQHPGGGGVSQHALRQTPPRERLLPRAVRILLECIPVELIFRLKVLLKI